MSLNKNWAEAVVRMSGVVCIASPVVLCGTLAAQCYVPGENRICCPSPGPRDCVSPPGTTPSVWSCPDISTPPLAYSTVRSPLSGETGRTGTRDMGSPGNCTREYRKCGPNSTCIKITIVTAGCPNSLMPDPLALQCGSGSGGTH